MSSQSRDKYVGSRIREYEILDVIGKGGMGAVYRARHVFLDHERAIKVIHSEFARDDAFVQRFIREAKMLAKLNHRNLVQLYEFGMLEQDVFFMVMELITGESLLDRVTRVGRLPIDEAVKIIREAALGLHAAHQKNIVHRDISPDNLLIIKDPDGTEITKVIDFGIAKPLTEQTRIYTRTNMFLGKPEFCSPEQCGNLEEGEVIDHRSDIYSLGITLYFSLTGKLPFYASTPAGYLVKQVSEAPKSITTHFPPGSFPPELEKIISKSLEKKRDQRYATMQEFAKALNEYKITPSVPSTSAVREAQQLGPGSVFERRYTIEKIIRTSSRGTFYKAVDSIINQPIILKILRKDPQQDAKLKQRLKRTLLLSRKVHHPNVCSLYDIGESEDCLFITMQYMEGVLLSDFLQESKIVPQDIAFRIMKDLISAVAELHSKGIIHRNLKTRNVVIDPENRAHIFDFANATSVLDPSKSEVSQAFGASPFTPPEVFNNKPLDNRSDIYSLGIILFQLASGTLPYKGKTLPAIIFSIMNSSPLKPSEANPQIHPGLEKIILKAIDKDPEKRYQAIEELQQAIKTLEENPAIVEADVEKSRASAQEAKQLFEEGKELYSQLKLEEAIDVWRRASTLQPDDDMIQKCLIAAENRLKRENQIRDEVKQLLAQCEGYIQEKKFEEAKKILDLCDKKMTSSPRFRELRDSIYSLWKRMDVKAERKKTENYHAESYQSPTSGGTKKP